MSLNIAYFFYAPVITFTEDPSDWLRFLQCLLILLTLIKITFYLRIFDGLSSLVNMLGQIFKDLIYFMFLYIIFIYAFSLMLTVVIGDSHKGYEGLNSGLALSFISLRTTLGDNEMDDYDSNSHQTLKWVVWLIIVLVGNVIFMNFIIAVVA